MNSIRRISLVFAFVGSTLCGAGCIAEDSGATHEEAAYFAEAEREIAERAGTMCVDLLAALVEEYPGWKSADFLSSFARESSVDWDPQGQCWVIQSLEEFEAAGDRGVADFVIRVQCLENGAPCQRIEGTEGEMHAHLESSNLGHVDRDRYSIDFEWAFDLDLQVVCAPSGDAVLRGQGHLSGRTETHVGEKSRVLPQNLVWPFELVLDANRACPAGQLSGASGEVALAARFEESGVASWSVTHRGMTLATGKRHLECHSSEWGEE